MAEGRPSRRRATALEELRKVVRTLAADGFAAAISENAGARLAAAVDDVLDEEPDAPRLLGLRSLRAKLADFDMQGRHARATLIAEAQRLALQLHVELPITSRRSSRRASSRGQRSALAGATSAAARRSDAPEKTIDFAGDGSSGKPTGRVTDLSGVGPRVAEQLAARGIDTIEDLAQLVPTTYFDRRGRKPLDEVAEGELVVVQGRVLKFREGWLRRGRYLATLHLEPDHPGWSGRPIEVRWFHRVGGLAQRLRVGETVALTGPLRRSRGRPSMVHPQIDEPAAGDGGIGVRYPTIEGLGPRRIARFCRAAIERLAAADSGFVDALPQALADRHGLPTQLDALRHLHAPPDDLADAELDALREGRSAAHRRLGFDRLFFLQLAALRERARWRSGGCLFSAPATVVDHERLRAVVPFEPTSAQWRALAEITADLGSTRPMLRLLQGDVGAGKTFVAFAAALSVMDGGGQVALMAPTEILAEQHLRSLRPWCERAGVRLALLTGATPRAERASLLPLLAAGRIDLLVGTHALLVEGVAFSRLGLVVVDEQHRFGVEQRARLRRKGGAPHLLVMTATPIPRTLALTAYGDLDVSILDELPPGREPVETRLVTGRAGLDRARRMVAKSVERGVKAFVVCPLVEASEALAASDVEAAAAALKTLISGGAVDVVHGRMSSSEKEHKMERFRSGDLRVLVATTVIEVGIDVPDARVMLVEHSERFGLAQLHQLRGRVGRSGGPSLCLLHTSHPLESEVGRRLAVLAETSDGFVVAERDLALRGPGELFGRRQAGAAAFAFDTRLLVSARDAAAAILEEDPELSRHVDLARELERRGIVRALAGDAG